MIDNQITYSGYDYYTTSNRTAQDGSPGLYDTIQFNSVEARIAIIIPFNFPFDLIKRNFSMHFGIPFYSL